MVKIYHTRTHDLHKCLYK